jgi:hypothetical protein
VQGPDGKLWGTTYLNGPPVWVTTRASSSPALTSGACEFEPKRLEPAPQLSSNGLVFKVPVPTRGLPRA